MLIELKPFWHIDHTEIKEVRLDLTGIKQIPCIVIRTTDKKLHKLMDFESLEEVEEKYKYITSLVNEWYLYIIREQTKIRELRSVNKFSVKGDTK